MTWTQPQQGGGREGRAGKEGAGKEEAGKEGAGKEGAGKEGQGRRGQGRRVNEYVNRYTCKYRSTGNFGQKTLEVHNTSQSKLSGSTCE